MGKWTACNIRKGKKVTEKGKSKIIIGKVAEAGTYIALAYHKLDLFLILSAVQCNHVMCKVAFPS